MSSQISRCEAKHRKLFKILNFRLPPSFRKIGLLCALLSFIFIIGYKFLGSNALLTKDIFRTLILFFLLMASLSRDKLEDEYNKYIRFQSYVLAFVITTVYSILLPLISLILDLGISQLRGEGSISFHEVSAFEVMFLLLTLQLLFFTALKKSWV